MIEHCSVDAGFDALGYAYATHGGYQADDGVMGERNLWCAVIAQAFLDIGAIRSATAPGKMHAGNHDSAETPHVREMRREHLDAMEWLVSDRSDFHMICMLAGVSPVVVKKAATRFIDAATG